MIEPNPEQRPTAATLAYTGRRAIRNFGKWWNLKSYKISEPIWSNCEGGWQMRRYSSQRTVKFSEVFQWKENWMFILN
jgi:hypothetical protein